MRKIDIGLVWAKGFNIWVQFGFIVGVFNTAMMVGVFYSTTVTQLLSIPLWLYLLVICVVLGACVVFVTRYAISGYYRFFNQQSDLAEVNRKVDMIIKHLGIEVQPDERLKRILEVYNNKEE